MADGQDLPWLDDLPEQPAASPACTWLAGGTNNQGVLLHHLKAGPSAEPLLVVEKRSRNRAEVRLLRRIQAWQQAGGEEAPFPRMFGIRPGRGGWRLFQSFVPEAVPVPADPEQAGRLLADLALRWHRCMDGVMGPERPGAGAVLRAQQRRLLAAGRDCGEPPDLQAQVVALAPRLQARLEAQPLVFCHNDLHWSNIRAFAAAPPVGAVGASSDPRLSDYRLIDLGRCGWNLPGAEWHVLLRQSLTGLGGAPVWRHALDCYGTCSGVDPALLRLACLWFALVQATAQCRRSRLQGREALARRDARLVRRLLARLSAALDDPDGRSLRPG